MAKIEGVRDRLLSSGLELFANRGYEAAGVAEITTAAGVPKGSFYNHFPSKEEFALAVLDLYRQEECRQMTAALAGSGSPLGRLRTLFRAGRERMSAGGFENGCLVGRLAQELAGHNPAFRAPVESAFRCMCAVIERLFDEAAAAGELPAGLDPRDAAEFALNAWQGATQRAKAAHSAAPLENFERLLFDRFLKLEA
jgi:TetR/AcrR family transcriptional repressor of nem operon